MLSSLLHQHITDTIFKRVIKSKLITAILATNTSDDLTDNAAMKRIIRALKSYKTNLSLLLFLQ